jgi:hypothetical protein
MVHTLKWFFNALTPRISPKITASIGKVDPTAVAVRQPTTLCSHSGLLRENIRLSGTSYCSSSAWNSRSHFIYLGLETGYLVCEFPSFLRQSAAFVPSEGKMTVCSQISHYWLRILLN